MNVQQSKEIVLHIYKLISQMKTNRKEDHKQLLEDDFILIKFKNMPN
jgi:hypothetical protein